VIASDSDVPKGRRRSRNTADWQPAT
jgi:hypothetical protein